MRDEDYPPWSPAFDDYDEPSFRNARRNAEALGWLVMAWGSLERDIGALLLRLIGTKFTYEIVGNVDFREKLAIIKSIGFEAQPTPAWFKALEEMIIEIDQNLRPARNRMIHDHWIFQEDRAAAMLRSCFTPKLRRRQPRKRTQERDILPIPPEEIWHLVARIFNARRQSEKLTRELERATSPQKSE